MSDVSIAMEAYLTAARAVAQAQVDEADAFLVTKEVHKGATDGYAERAAVSATKGQLAVALAALEVAGVALRIAEHEATADWLSH